MCTKQCQATCMGSPRLRRDLDHAKRKDYTIVGHCMDSEPSRTFCCGLLSTPTESAIEFQLHFYRFPSKSNWVLIRIESKPYPNPVGFLSNADRSPIVSHNVPAKVLCDSHRLHTPFPWVWNQTPFELQSNTVRIQKNPIKHLAE